MSEDEAVVCTICEKRVPDDIDWVITPHGELCYLCYSKIFNDIVKEYQL